ncbi:unnamed protein product [Linum tenue]|uniref:Glycosyltransferase family 92 protein n=1 Tax=Linum tenue TaxID=586396 RepID=A0AAV0HAZ5_9ROSI|nr:unnamed protein product [Linum tenue]
MKAPPRLLPLLLPVPAASSRLFETTTRGRCAFLLLCLFLFVSLSIFLSLSPNQLLLRSFDYSPAAAAPTVVAARPNLSAFPSNSAVRESTGHLNKSSVPEAREDLESVSILFPDWEVVVIGPAGISGEEEESGFLCVYPNKATSPARFSGNLRATNQSIFTCWMPEKCRRRLQSPVLVRRKSPAEGGKEKTTKSLLRWTFLAYESLSTESDVVLFVKGVNNKQGVNRPAHELKCVFGNPDDSAVKTTAVTSSEQEVFRCGHPDLTGYGQNVTVGVRVTLELPDGVRVPSVAHYSPWRRSSVVVGEAKLQICAATMVYNAAKFLKEWVIYHSGIGVEKFFLYDNGSDDGLGIVVGELNREGYRVETVPWIWAKTQEAGFSHAAVYARESCDWMMYIDVDEFLFSPRWSSAAQPSDRMLKSLIPRKKSAGRVVGQVTIRCNEFGPSGRVTHPPDGVTQGYDCRRKLDNRHKSIVLLEAIDDSLLNAVHHFRLRGGGGGEGGKLFRTKQVGMGAAVVNHYKYQAWSEFRAKFRRRVSAYVVDWRRAVNPASKDRAPGLGFEPVKPGDWERRFCEVRDDRLKSLVRRWYGGLTAEGGGGYRMAWQR